MIEITILIGLTVGLVEVVKRVFKWDKRFLPAVAVLFGIVLAFLVGVMETLGLTLLTGIGIGLASSGLFDFGKFGKKIVSFRKATK